MTISVVVTTYNGEKFILEQLSSILNQTRVPDEVIICDDGSADGTQEIIHKFIGDNNLSNWKFIINDTNKGFRKNFIDGIYKTAGEIIFLSDQDDVWPSDRVEVMAEAMENNNRILALAGFRDVIDENGNIPPAAYPYPVSGDTKKVQKIEFNGKNCAVSRSGCITCFSINLIKHIKALWVGNLSHDFIIWRLACIFDGAYEIDYTVLRYRIHTQNTSGVSVSNYLGKGDVKDRVKRIRFEIGWFGKYADYIKKSAVINDKEKKVKILQSYINMLKQREKFLSTKNVLHGVELIRYRSYYMSTSKLFGDFAYAYGLNRICGGIFWNLIKR